MPTWLRSAPAAIAFTGLTDVPLPEAVVELQVEAGELAGGWTDFNPDIPRGSQDLPIVDAVADQIFARANELRLGPIRHSPHAAAAEALTCRAGRPSRSRSMAWLASWRRCVRNWSRNFANCAPWCFSGWPPELKIAADS